MPPTTVASVAPTNAFPHDATAFARRYGGIGFLDMPPAAGGSGGADGGLVPTPEARL